MKYNRIATASAAAILAALVLAGHGQATATGSRDATPPCTSAYGDRMQSGECLLPGQSIASANGCYAVVYQPDGNLVLYRTGSTNALWASNIFGSSAGRAIMQTDGNLVVYDASATAVWASNTAGNSASWLNVQDDGNVVIYRTNGTAAWSTHTVQPSCTTTPPLPQPTPIPPTPTPRTRNGGDANCDGAVNSIDAMLVLQLEAGLMNTLQCPGFADVNWDHQANAVDATIILQMDAGLLDRTLPPPSKYIYLDSLDNGDGTFAIGVANLAMDWTACDLTVWIEVLNGREWVSDIRVHVLLGDFVTGDHEVVTVLAPESVQSWSASRSVAEWRWC
jgi:hypothetical protein